MEKDSSRCPIRIYLGLVYFICYGLGALELAAGTGGFYRILGVAFTFLPVVMSLITRRVTGRKGTFHLSFRVWKNARAWLFSALAPGILIVLGAVLYFLIFPNEYSGVFRYGLLLGSDAEAAVQSPMVTALICIVIAGIMLPVQLQTSGCPNIATASAQRPAVRAAS